MFLAAGRASGVSFARCATVGRQAVSATPRQVERACAVARCPVRPGESGALGQGWVEPLLRHFGAGAVASVDASGYEGATHVHDLNADLPEELVGQFTLVLDVGTLEHVFDFPKAVRNVMRMVAPGHHLVIVTPCNNEAGHGFYQFSPELFFRVLSPRYGFELERMLLCEAGRRFHRWYRVVDPELVGARGQFRSRAVTLLYVRARRVGDVSGFTPPPQQSDYAAAWSGQEHLTAGSFESLKRVGRRHAPNEVKKLYRWLRSRVMPNYLHLRDDYRRLREHFEPVDGPWA